MPTGIFDVLTRIAIAGEAGEMTSPPRSRIADSFPDVPLVDQYGHALRFRQAFVQPNQALVINSMYTTCRGSCPVTSSKIAKLRKTLAPIFGDQLTFLSFTLEPKIDTPDVLRDYARIYKADKPRPDWCDWRFLTASQADTDRLRRALGMFDLNPKVDADITQHASLLLAGNVTTDRWCALPATLRESTLVESIRRLGGTTFEQKYGIPG